MCSRAARASSRRRAATLHSISATLGSSLVHEVSLSEVGYEQPERVEAGDPGKYCLSIVAMPALEQRLGCLLVARQDTAGLSARGRAHYM